MPGKAIGDERAWTGQHRGFTAEGKGAVRYAGWPEYERRRGTAEEVGFSENPAPCPNAN